MLNVWGEPAVPNGWGKRGCGVWQGRKVWRGRRIFEVKGMKRGRLAASARGEIPIGGDLFAGLDQDYSSVTRGNV